METTADKPKRAYRKRKPLSQQQELDMLEVYCTTDQSLTKLAKLFDVNDTYIYRVLERWHVDWRRDSPEKFDFAAWRAAQSLEPQPALDLDRLNAGTGFATPGSIKQIGAVPIQWTEPRATWLVETTERFEIEATDIDTALSEAHRLRPGARITSVKVRA